MLEVMKSIFGASLQEDIFSLPPGTPNYIRYGYIITKLIWGDKSCLLVRPKTDTVSLSALKKQAKQIEQICSMPVIIDLERLTASQRTNLIESGFAFISGPGQIFIPFWGSYFEEKIRNPPEEKDVLSGMAQLVFLYLYYHRSQAAGGLSQTQIALSLRTSKASVSRAVRELQGLGFLSLQAVGTANRVLLHGGNKILNTAWKHLRSPVRKKLYATSLPSSTVYKLSSLLALSQQSMLSSLSSDSGYAISRETAKQLPKDFLICEQAFRDFGGVVLEIWEYDPALLSDGECVDDLSLLLELQNHEDERIQIELDTLRKKYCLIGE